MQELSVLGANDTNTTADANAIDFEAENLGDEFYRLMSTSKYKGKSIFVSSAGSEYVSLGGRDAEMTFGIATPTYSGLYSTSATASTTAVKAGRVYEILVDNDDLSSVGGPASGTDGNTFIATKTGTAAAAVLERANSLVKAPSEGQGATTNTLTALIETVQANINTARVQAGSQYAALESAVSFTTDLTAQYELGFNTVNDVNFSMETAHLAKNQILQQAATAMLAQANQGQQGLLQLIQN